MADLIMKLKVGQTSDAKRQQEGAQYEAVDPVRFVVFEREFCFALIDSDVVVEVLDHVGAEHRQSTAAHHSTWQTVGLRLLLSVRSAFLLIACRP